MTPAQPFEASTVLLPRAGAGQSARSRRRRAGPLRWHLTDIGPDLNELGDSSPLGGDETGHLEVDQLAVGSPGHMTARHRTVTGTDQVLDDEMVEPGVLGVESYPPVGIELLTGVDKASSEVVAEQGSQIIPGLRIDQVAQPGQQSRGIHASPYRWHSPAQQGNGESAGPAGERIDAPRRGQRWTAWASITGRLIASVYITGMMPVWPAPAQVTSQ